MARKPKPGGLPDKGKKQGRRPNDARPLRAYFLIVGEGTKTEPNYFRRFRVPVDVKVKVIGRGEDPLSLVNETLDLKQTGDYTDVWVVFDRDSFPAQRFNEAISRAQREGIQVAYSNEAFELWYLLHFHYHDTATSRELYGPMLSQCLGRPYRENDATIYDDLLSKQPTAIRNAEALLASYGEDHNPERDNPCTTVHRLVQALNEQAH